MPGRGDADLRHPHDLRSIGAAEPLERRLGLLQRRPRPRGDPQPRQLEHPLGLAPALQPRRDVGPHQEDELVLGPRVAQQLQRTEAERRPLAAVSTSEASISSVRRRRQPRHLQPHLRARLRIDPLVRRLAGRHQQHPIEPQLERRLLGEHQVPDVRRVERAPENADRGDLPPTPDSPDLAVAVDDVLERGQLAQADRPARMELLGRVADLGPHPELEPVGEARRRVDVDDRGVDPVRELLGRLVGDGHDRLRVAGAVHGSRVRSRRPASPRPRPPSSCPRYSVSQSASVASPTGGIPAAARARSSPTSSTPASRRSARTPGRNSLGDLRVDEQRLRRVADPGALHLRVVGDPAGHLEVGVRVDVDVAVPRRRVHHRHGRDRLERLLQPLAAARDDQVDQSLRGGQLRELGAVSARRAARRTPPAAPPRQPPRAQPPPAPRWSAPRSSSPAGRSRCRSSA